MLLTKIVFMMTIAMPQLPYSPNALEPVISEQTINYHYGKHLQAYVNTLGTLVQGTEFEGKSVDEIVMTAPDGPIFNNAGQTLNHALYFGQFKSPVKDNVPTGKLADESMLLLVVSMNLRSNFHKQELLFSALVGFG